MSITINRDRVLMVIPCLTSIGEQFELPETHFYPGSIGEVIEIRSQAMGSCNVVFQIVSGSALPRDQRLRIGPVPDHQLPGEGETEADRLDLSTMSNLTPRERFANGIEEIIPVGYEGENGASQMGVLGETRPRTGSDNRVIENSMIDGLQGRNTPHIPAPAAQQNPVVAEIMQGMGANVAGANPAVAPASAEALRDDHAAKALIRANQAALAADLGVRITTESMVTRSPRGRRKSTYSKNYSQQDGHIHRAEYDPSIQAKKEAFWQEKLPQMQEFSARRNEAVSRREQIASSMPGEIPQQMNPQGYPQQAPPSARGLQPVHLDTQPDPRPTRGRRRSK